MAGTDILSSIPAQSSSSERLRSSARASRSPSRSHCRIRGTRSLLSQSAGSTALELGDTRACSCNSISDSAPTSAPQHQQQTLDDGGQNRWEAIWLCLRMVLVLRTELGIEQAGSPGSRALARCFSSALFRSLRNEPIRYLPACLIPSQVTLHSFPNQHCVFNGGSQRESIALSFKLLHSSSVAPSPSSVSELLKPTFVRALFNEAHPQCKRFVMGSDENRSAQTHKPIAGKGASRKPKSAGSKDKKRAAKKQKGSVEKKTGKNKSLGMPSDVEGGEEGEYEKDEDKK
ncbi:hypothetical protein N431DRAFT_448833 [Stipitochalara longipes BDJ]|nr:hypothetical protein N431DRAFT_448833 [Stipitochalara longipes BDJ]